MIKRRVKVNMGHKLTMKILCFKSLRKNMSKLKKIPRYPNISLTQTNTLANNQMKEVFSKNE